MTSLTEQDYADFEAHSLRLMERLSELPDPEGAELLREFNIILGFVHRLSSEVVRMSAGDWSRTKGPA